MGNEVPEQQRPPADTAAPPESSPQSPGQEMHGDLAPDLEVEPEHPAQDEEDVERMWEASDPVEGEAPTG
ncbi:MAG: hypothetical protein M3O70_01910 [Actinomycetota bacterium]|nr:hypothetical protein [Actinomycetota bacterium]